jgi:hypothetical protein
MDQKTVDGGITSSIPAKASARYPANILPSC